MMLDRTAPTLEKLLDAADIFRGRIEREIERAIADVDPTSPRAEECRAMLRQIRASLPDVSLPNLMRVAVLDNAMNGACFATIKATLGVIGPAPLMLELRTASAILEIFSDLIADLHRARLN